MTKEDRENFKQIVDTFYEVFNLYKAKGASDDLAMKLTAASLGIQPINKPPSEIFFGKL